MTLAVLTLYRALGYLFLPLVLPVLLLHPKLRGRLGERFGYYPHIPAAGPRVWVHAASAGDVRAVIPLLKALRNRAPDADVILTVSTSTGKAMAYSLGFPPERVLFAPLDLPHICNRAVRRAQPSLLLLEYAELWPNLVNSVRRHGGKIALTDGRVSPRGFSRAKLARSLYRGVLEQVDLFMMRSAGDAERIEALGASRDRILITGNTKYDAPTPSASEVEALRRQLQLESDRPLLVLGNTHTGEEQVLLRVYARLLADFPSLRCLVAPRYPDRCTELEDLCAQIGLSCTRRSAIDDQAQVILLDSVGELAAAYGLGWVAFVGGSFTTRGGQNVLEPAVHGVPVLYGPSTVNFREEVALLTGSGGIEVADGDEFEGEVRALLEDEDRRRTLGQAAARQVASLQGAAAENAAQIASLLT